MNTTPDHPDFTALALGEHIHGTPARQVLDALRTSVAARQEAEQLRATAAQLSFVLKGQPPQRLDNKRRNAIFNADIEALRERFAAEEREEETAQFETVPRPVVTRRRPAWIYPTVAVAAIAAVTVTVLQLLPGHSGSANTTTPVVKADAGHSGGSIVVTPNQQLVSSPRSHVLPGVTVVPAPQVTPQNNTPLPRETVPSAPVPSSSVPLMAKEDPPSPEVPEVAPAKPPFRNDLRDYTSPPRVPQKK